MLQIISDSLKDFPPEVADIIMKAWRGSTHKQYDVYLKQWILHCSEMKTNPHVTHINTVLNFLTKLHKKGLSYSSINAARSALSNFAFLEDNSKIGTNPWVSKFMKGIFHIKPPLPRYKEIWEVRPVLQMLRTWAPNESLELKYITLKLCILLALIGSTRVQFLYALNIDKIKRVGDQFTLRVDELMKTDRQGKQTGHELTLSTYPHDKTICACDILQCYIAATAEIRGHEKRMFISYKKPHAAVSKVTISNWIRKVLALAGINTDIFSAHSVRAAAVSKLKAQLVPVGEIMQRAGWTQESTFQKFYNKPIKNYDVCHQVLLD